MISIGSMMSLNDNYSLDDNDDDMEVTPSPHMRLKRKLSSGNIKAPSGTSTSPVFSTHIKFITYVVNWNLILWLSGPTAVLTTIQSLFQTCIIKMNCWKSTSMCETNGSHKHFHNSTWLCLVHSSASMLIWLFISIGNSMICSDIWHKYHEWYFKIVIRNFPSR